MKTLDEFLFFIRNKPEDFCYLLDAFLDAMPHTRESVEEMIDALISHDEEEIYKKLLKDFADLLTPDESEKLNADYERMTGHPLQQD